MPYISGLTEYNVSWEPEGSVASFTGLLHSATDIRDIREWNLLNMYHYARRQMHRARLNRINNFSIKLIGHHVPVLNS